MTETAEVKPAQFTRTVKTTERVKALNTAYDQNVKNTQTVREQRLEQERVTQEAENDQQTQIQNKISALQVLYEPEIGEGEMPFLIGVEYFKVGGQRTHGHIYGRTDRGSNGQVWRIYDATGDDRNGGPLRWSDIIESYLMMPDQSVRLFFPREYAELYRHCSLNGKVNEFPDSPSKYRPETKAVEELAVKADNPPEVEGGQQYLAETPRLESGAIVQITVQQGGKTATVERLANPRSLDYYDVRRKFQRTQQEARYLNQGYGPQDAERLAAQRF